MKQMFKIDDRSVTLMVRDLLRRDDASRAGATTYLRTLIAAVQVALGGKVRVAAQGRVKEVTTDEALAALNAENGRFYSIVLAELPDGLEARERNARSGFARSAVSTIRAAIRAGLNPLEIVVPGATKDGLRQFAKAHSPAPAITTTAAQQTAKFLIRRIGKLLEGLNDDDKADVIEFVHNELNEVEERAGVKAKPPAPVEAPRRRASDFVAGGGSSH
jgi:hypothetical protein